MTFQPMNQFTNNSTEDMDYLKCKKCEEIKPETEFRVNRYGDYRKICIKCLKWDRKGVGPSDRELCDLLLQRMGYNPNENIHEQFMEKHKEKFDYVND
jgi:hypothetical protein